MTGSRAGQRERFTKSVVAVGRHPLCDFRFDPANDLDVSTRHAEIRAVGGQYVLHDIGSTNGTFVNGLPVPNEQALVSGDVVSFGEFGPRVEVVIEPDDAAVPERVTAARSPAAAAAPAPAPVAASRPARVSTGTDAQPPATRSVVTAARRAVPSRRTESSRHLRAAAGALIVVAALGGAYWAGHRRSTPTSAEPPRVASASDSLSHPYAERTVPAAAPAASTDSPRVAAPAPAAAPSLPKPGPRPVERVSAEGDYSTIAKRSGPAVVLVAVQWPDSSAFSGSGFSISSRGEIVTNRHLVQRAGAQMPLRIAVIFSDTKAWLPAHVVKVSASADLALLQVDRAGPFPAVAGIVPHAASTAVGKAVAIIGYPLGTDTPMEGSGTRITARSTLVAGTLSKNLADVLQIDAYAGEGSSGSPVFNTAGNVIGVVYGGARESAGRIVYAVPSDAIGSLSQNEATGSRSW